MIKLIAKLKNLFVSSYFVNDEEFKLYCHKRNSKIGSLLLILTLCLEILFSIPFIIRYKFNFPIMLTKFYFKMYMILIVISIIGIIIIKYIKKRFGEYSSNIEILQNIYIFIFIVWSIVISRMDLIRGNTSIVYMQMLLYVSVFFLMKFKNILIIYSSTYLFYLLMIFFTEIRFGRLYPELINSISILILGTCISCSKYCYELKNYKDLKIIEEKNKKLESMNKELYKLSIIDPLTHIYNRYKLEEIIMNEYKKSIDNNTETVFIMMDIDYFKRFNDTYGHIAGDECLKKISDRLYFIIRKHKGYIGRYGGEEFLAIISNTDNIHIQSVLKQITKGIEELNIINEKSEVSPYVTMTVGACEGKLDEKTIPNIFIETADKALYEGKERGRNQYVLRHIKINN